MSRNQKNSTKIEDVFVPRQFHIRHWDTWLSPSLIVILSKEERLTLKSTFGLHWDDLDIRVGLVDECVGTGSARDGRPRRDAGVKVVTELNRVADGIQILLYVVAMPTDGRKQLLDENGYPRKLSFERILHEDRLQELFNKANAFLKGMESYKLAMWAQEKGDEKSYREMGVSLQHFRDTLGESSGNDNLTAKVGDIVREGNARKDRKKGKVRAEKIAKVSDNETADDRTDDIARRLAAAVTGIDPGTGIIEPDSVEPEASASPVPAPAPAPKQKKEKKDRPAPVKLGLKDLESLKGQLPPGPSDGSNGQS